VRPYDQWLDAYGLQPSRALPRDLWSIGVRL